MIGLDNVLDQLNMYYNKKYEVGHIYLSEISQV